MLRFNIILCLIAHIIFPAKNIAQKWSEEKAWSWYEKQPWLVGTNFNPSSSINQLEFWQVQTFDAVTIERELKWSSEIGMNLHRVYLHNLLWEQDSKGFLERLNIYLSIADKYKIKTIFVLLDDVWHPQPKLGKQPDPIPHLHNSGWVQAPGAEILGNLSLHDELESYIKGVISEFANDERVLLWDLYNEPDNRAKGKGRAKLELRNKNKYSLALLRKTFQWAREVNPTQPLTTGIWRGNISNWGILNKLPELDRFMLENSDVISFHAYDGKLENVTRKISELKKYNRPLFCTEYLARSHGNTFEMLMPLFKKENIAAINWGLVDGKTNTKYPWKSWVIKLSKEPKVWHHDIFRSDGSPYSKSEITFIKKMTLNK
ncbi:MAG: cellulase family glycosylhydrolase [Flavobacteriaceae bacterium]|nr:cellulase family glycosylhydrolase [Flavobacteriaceae bacterium]